MRLRLDAAGAFNPTFNTERNPHMLLDEYNEFCDSSGATAATIGPGGATLTVTASTTTQIGDQIPLSAARDLGPHNNQPVYLVVIAGTALSVVASTSTIVFNLLTDGAAPTGSPTTLPSPTIVAFSPSIALSTTAIAAGTVLCVLALPFEVLTAYEAYLGLSHTNGATNALAAGCRIDAFLTTNPPRWKAYADATN